ncbi:hypothetical protein [Inhella crocodyli]|uniref:Uncharacterized protein n=1 Tax=Inhella crocodyli TaxID=2499851 RepID=A0A3S2XQV7_9BURK|nr:hypothetical protein [Inhella crocodyli]RVT82445.1 hypothetical protein EOD73_17075 [Inhella crocodyli]
MNQIPLQDLRVTACIDRVKLDLKFAQPTQGVAVYRTLRSKWVISAATVPEGFDPLRCTEFRLWLNDPGSPQEVQALIAFLDAWRPLAEPVRISGLEVAVDLRAVSPDGRASYPEIGTLVWKGQSKPPSDRRIATWRETMPSGAVVRRYQAVTLDRECADALKQGFSLQCGNLGASTTSRVYIKTKDTPVGGDGLVELPMSEQCVRFERTWTGDDCAIRTLDDWRLFDFRALATQFGMRQFEFENPRNAYLSAGKVDDERARRAKKRLSRRGTRVDGRWAIAVRSALRRLNCPGSAPVLSREFGEKDNNLALFSIES